MTTPFGAPLENALKQDIQGGKFHACKGRVIAPRFFCCVTGQPIGVVKAPVAVLKVTPTRICSGDSVRADICGSWAPVPVLAVLDHGYIDWGDGHITTFGPPWPCLGGGGVYNHTYTLDPGVPYRQYTITLVIYDDPVNAMGEDTQTIEVIDCSGMGEPALLMYAGCGASGVFKSRNSALSWEAIGLAGIKIYNLDANYFFIQEIWAATEKGLYKTYNGGGGWTLVDPNMNLESGAEVAAVMCSLYDPQEVYALVHDPNWPFHAWLYRTVDSGRTWEFTLLAEGCSIIGELDCTPGGNTPTSHQIAWFQSYLHVCAPGSPSPSNIYKRNYATQTWSAVGGPIGFDGICYGHGYLWAVTQSNDSLYRYSGLGWVLTDSASVGANYDHLTILSNGTICVSTTGGQVHIYTAGGIFVCIANDPVPIQGGNLGSLGTVLLSQDQGFGDLVYYKGDWVTGDFVSEGSASVETYSGIQEYWGSAYIASWWAANAVRRKGGAHAKWVKMALPRDVTGTHSVQLSNPPSPGKRLLGVFATGASDWYIYEWLGSRWTKRMCKLLADAQTALRDRQDWLVVGGSWISRVELDTEGVKVHSDGRQHLLSMSADGSSIYVGVLNRVNDPVILRVDYDLGAVDILYNPGTGTWGGVKADPNLPGRVWIFGDFGFGTKVHYSDEYGDGWVDVTDIRMCMGGGYVVRPVLPSIYNPADVVAILNGSTPAECYRSQNEGTDWARINNNLPFDCHCADRSFLDDFDVFLGRLNAGASHLLYSPNYGQTVVERSTGFSAGAPVSAIVIAGLVE